MPDVSVLSLVPAGCRGTSDRKDSITKQTVSVLARSNDTLAPSMEKLLDSERLPLLLSLDLVLFTSRYLQTQYSSPEARLSQLA